jgi:hypothetical protein
MADSVDEAKGALSQGAGRVPSSYTRRPLDSVPTPIASKTSLSTLIATYGDYLKKRLRRVS